MISMFGCTSKSIKSAYYIIENKTRPSLFVNNLMALSLTWNTQQIKDHFRRIIKVKIQSYCWLMGRLSIYGGLEREREREQILDP